MTKIESQEEVWDKIAQNWKNNGTFPLKEAEEFLNNKKGRILDLGCGSGKNIIKTEDKEFYGVDFSKEMINTADKEIKERGVKAKLLKANAWELPFPADYFDAAVFIATLHCIPDAEKRKKSLQELRRVLKPKSRALITVWDKDIERFKGKKETMLPWGIGDGESRREYMRYYYLYDKEEISKLLEKYFKIINIKSSKEGNSRFAKRNLIIEVEKA